MSSHPRMLATAVAVLAPVWLLAGGPVNTFTNGDIADATEVNANFGAITDRLDALEGEAPAGGYSLEAASSVSCNTGTSGGGSNTPSKIIDGNDNSIWDTADGQTWTGLHCAVQYPSAFVAKKLRLKWSNDPRVQFVWMGSTDGGDYQHLAAGQVGGTGSHEFFANGNQTAYSFYRVFVHWSSSNTTSSDWQVFEVFSAN